LILSCAFDEDLMRMLAALKVFAVPPPDVRGVFLLIGIFLFFVGCTSKNSTTDLGSTTWVAQTQYQNGKPIDLADQKSELSFTRNGTFRWTKGTGTQRRVIEGSYELAFGKTVVLLLKDTVEGSKTHVAEITVTKDAQDNPIKLSMKDVQGTIEFEAKK
jgi:hypothetical protein